MRAHRTLPRLFISGPLAAHSRVALSDGQAHYLLHVLRMAEGEKLLVFNGRDGEWLAAVRREGKKAARLDIGEPTRPQTTAPDISLCVAPIKAARLDLAVQKATEIGVAAIRPIVTARAQFSNLRTERLRAIAIEAAEQCGALDVPEILEPVALVDWLAEPAPGRVLVHCDEHAPSANPLAALRPVADAPVDLLIGPEGGFSEEERAAILGRPGCLAISLGPRILRAETAAIVALALILAARQDR